MKVPTMPLATLVLPLACLLLTVVAHANALHIAVAASFKPDAEELATQYPRNHHVAPRITAASTGALYSQILHGAPYGLFLAADADSPARLAAAGLAADEPRCFARGQLVLIGAEDLSTLADPALSLAIANPATAPYGRAAEQILERDAFVAGAQRKLVRAQNALQAFQLWQQNTVDLALVPLPLAKRFDVAHSAIPSDWHAPLEHFAVRLTQPLQSDAATAFMTYLLSSSTQARLASNGYLGCNG